MRRADSVTYSATTRQDAGDGRQHILDPHGEQCGIGLGRERLPSPDRLVGQHDVRPRRRTPFRGRGRTEEHDGGPAIRGREVRGARVGRHDDPRRPDDARELPEVDLAGEHGGFVMTGVARDLESTLPLARVARVHDVVALRRQAGGHGGEALDRPAPRAVEGADVHDCGAWPHARRTGREADVIGIRVDAVRSHEPHPAVALEHAVLPRRDPRIAAVVVEAGHTMHHRKPGAQLVDPAAALRALAVHVHGDVDATGLERERIVETGRGQQVVDAADELDDRREPAGHGEHEAVLRERAAKAVDGGHRDEEVAELERPQDHELGTTVRWAEVSHLPSIPGPESGRVVAPVFGEAVPGAKRKGMETLLVDAVLFDRDGTLVQDVPYNGDPAAVRAMPGARDAVARLRRAGVRVGVVSNQSGIGRGILTHDDVQAVNARADELVGPIEVWEYCPHDPEAACECRKPRPGLVLRACRQLGADPRRTVVVGDIGTDVEAAAAAGCAAILVPTPVTLRDEIAAAPVVAADLAEAVDLVMAARDAAVRAGGVS